METRDAVPVRNYRDLLAWQKAMDLADLVYQATGNWPQAEAYGLTSQIRRAAVSIPSNIAEGQGRSGSKEFLHHLSIARGSLLEVETQAQLAERFGYLTRETTVRLLASTGEVGRLINGLYRSIANRTRPEIDS